MVNEEETNFLCLPKGVFLSTCYALYLSHSLYISPSPSLRLSTYLYFSLYLPLSISLPLPISLSLPYISIILYYTLVQYTATSRLYLCLQQQQQLPFSHNPPPPTHTYPHPTPTYPSFTALQMNFCRRGSGHWEQKHLVWPGKCNLIPNYKNCMLASSLHHTGTNLKKPY